MKKKFQYIVFVLIIIIIYELYLIFSFKYIDLEKDSIILKHKEEIKNTKIYIEKNKDYFAYINTNSYKDYIAKSAQNKKNQEEDVIFIISKEDSINYKEIDTKKQIVYETEVKKETHWMTYFQKWIYYIFNIDIRY
jgi:biopolymer transport protein ExbD